MQCARGKVPRIEEIVAYARPVESRVACRERIADVLLEDAQYQDGQRRVEHVVANDKERVIYRLRPRQHRYRSKSQRMARVTPTK